MFPEQSVLAFTLVRAGNVRACQSTTGACASEVTKRREWRDLKHFTRVSGISIIFLCRPFLSSLQKDLVSISRKPRYFLRKSPGFTPVMGRIAKCMYISRSLYHTAVSKPWPQSFRTEFQRFSQVRDNFCNA